VSGHRLAAVGSEARVLVNTEKAPRLRDLVYKAPSPIHGTGCFARKAFSAGEHIGTYCGPEVRRNGTYVLWVYAEGQPPVGRSGRNLLRYLNHQRDGNAQFDGFELYARRDIASGEEITFDYNADEDSDSWRCALG